MGEVVHEVRAFRNPAGSDRLTNLSHRFLLPAAALTSLFLGLALLLDPLTTVGDYAPFALFAAGLGALATLTSMYQWWNPTPPRAESNLGAVTSLPPAPPSASVAPGSMDRPRRSTINGRGAEWRVLSVPPTPGNGLSWLIHGHGRPGPEAAGSAPGVVHSPGKSGNLVWFPVRNYLHGVRPATRATDDDRSTRRANTSPSIPPAGDPPGSPTTPWGGVHTPSSPARVARPLSDEELDRMFPPATIRRPYMLPDAPEKVGGLSSWARVMDPDDDAPARTDESASPTGSLSPTAEGDGDPDRDYVPFADERVDGPRVPDSTATSRSGSFKAVSRQVAESTDLFLEAANPVPPHLRSAGVHAQIEAHRPTRRSMSFAGQRSVCASCSKVVVDLRMSGPCPNCLRPICNDCLRESLATRGHGWCVDCSAAHSVGVS
jgi:hypothetical protein